MMMAASVAVDGEAAFVVISLNHKNLDLHLRESVKQAFSAWSSPDGIKGDIGSFCTELVVLDTCNRWEIYAVLGEAATPGDITRSLEVQWMEVAKTSGLASAGLPWVVFRGEEALVHLFEVCSGVDSQVVGETEIFGQVKQGFSDACDNGWVGKRFHRVFSKAFQTTKWLRTHTQIGRGQVSIGNVVADLANRIFGDLVNCRVLVVGTGEVGTLTAQALASRGVRQLAVAARDKAKAKLLAESLTATDVDFEGLANVLRDSDIVVACTSAPGWILDFDTISVAMIRRPGRPLFLIDLAVPRDVDPGCGQLNEVYLYNLDDVSAIANENLEHRRAHIFRCQEVIREKAASLWQDLTQRWGGV